MSNPTEPQPAQIQAEGVAQQPQPEFEVHTPAAAVPPVGQQPEPGLPNQQPKPKKTGVVVLVVLAVLLLGAAATFGVLYVNEKNARAEQVKTKDGEIAELAQKAKDEAAASTKFSDDRRKLENDMAGMKRCHDAATKLADAALADDIPRGQQAMVSVLANC